MAQWVKDLALSLWQRRFISVAVQWVKRTSTATAAKVTASAWIQSLSWELSYDVGAAKKKGGGEMNLSLPGTLKKWLQLR